MRFSSIPYLTTFVNSINSPPIIFRYINLKSYGYTILIRVEFYPWRQSLWTLPFLQRVIRVLRPVKLYLLKGGCPFIQSSLLINTSYNINNRGNLSVISLQTFFFIQQIFLNITVLFDYWYWNLSNGLQLFSGFIMNYIYSVYTFNFYPIYFNRLYTQPLLRYL